MTTTEVPNAEIVPMLIVSTVHLTEFQGTNLADAPAPCHPTRYGALVYLNREELLDDIEFAAASTQLARLEQRWLSFLDLLRQFAEQFPEIVYVLFDADAEPLEWLPKFDW